MSLPEVPAGLEGGNAPSSPVQVGGTLFVGESLLQAYTRSALTGLLAAGVDDDEAAQRAIHVAERTLALLAAIEPPPAAEEVPEP